MIKQNTNGMFESKDVFIKNYKERIIQVCGRELKDTDKSDKFLVLGDMIREYASINWKESKDNVSQKKQKQLYYFSMEFLIGRLFTNNLMNLNIYEVVKSGLEELDIDINEIEDVESDAGLGNGGLGRLAACFLDSLASLSLAGNGNCIRYQYGLFKQKIVDGHQVEVPDQWLKIGNIWEVRKPKHSIDVKFYGNIQMSKNSDGRLNVKHVDSQIVCAVPYDMPVIGHNTTQTNTLRLWSAEPSDQLPANLDFIKYLQDVNSICLNVYPDDSTEDGRMLRIKQEYFFVCAGLNSIVKNHLSVYNTLDNFADKVIIQLNDTHPVLCIPELMRILMDEYDYDWDVAWSITTKCMAYTNHTILSEALEKWPVHYIRTLLPRLYMIICEIDRRFKIYAGDKFNHDENRIYRCCIIKDDTVHMANLAVIASISVNGVAALHTEIIKKDLFADFVTLWPNKFNNKTNGITHRRWLLYSNPQLTKMLNDTIGTEYVDDLSKLQDLMNYVDDKSIQKQFLEIKYERKEILAKLIKDKTNIDIDTNSIFDTQAKRLHAYKRQLLNVMHIIYLYQKIKSDSSFTMHPQTFIFAAKAAPAYVFAKQVIKLINSLADVINNDDEANKFIKVVFIPNYSVSIAEKLMNASDISEQISTAGKEASGTGNMKFMMNGAITLGTLDGANVEIDELVGRDNDIIFGLNAEQVNIIKQDYNSWELYNSDERIKNVIDSLIDNTWADNTEEFRVIYNDLLFNNDEYLLLQDFDAYVKAQQEVQKLYIDKSRFAKSCLINIAKSGFFTSDRTIKQYADEIWNIEKVCN